MKKDSISVVLPVHNAQNWIANHLELLLDGLADLTSTLEIIVVDDGSTDFTVEVVEDLRRRYPQLRLVMHPRQLGLPAASQSGMNVATGGFLFVQEEGGPVRLSDLIRLWTLRGDRQLVSARARSNAKRIDDNLLQRLSQWAGKVTDNWSEPAAPPATSGLHMIRREALEQLRNNPDREGQLEVAHISHQALTGPKMSRAHVPAT